MKRFSILLFVFAAVALSQAQIKSVTICPAGLEHKAGARLMTCRPTGDQFYVYADTVLTERDLVSTRPANHNNKNVIILEFRTDAKVEIKAATTQYLGQYLAVLFDETLISVMKISAPLNRELLLVDGEFSGDGALEIYLKLQKLIGKE